MAIAACGPVGSHTQILLAEGATDDLDHAQGSGGFDDSLEVGVRYIPEVHDCSAQVDQVVQAWVDAHALYTVQRHRGAGRLSIRIRHANGLFKIVYRKWARGATVTFVFVDERGRNVEPTFQTLQTKEVARRLSRALKC
jgi:hypothetical protein